MRADTLRRFITLGSEKTKSKAHARGNSGGFYEMEKLRRTMGHKIDNVDLKANRTQNYRPIYPKVRNEP